MPNRRYILNALVRLSGPERSSVQAVINRINRGLGSVKTKIDVVIDRRTEARIARTTRRLNEMAKAAKQTGDAAHEAGKGIEGFGKLSALAVRRYGAFVAATWGFHRLAQAISASTKKAFDFERQMVRVAQVTNTSLKGLKFLEREVTRLSVSLGVSSEELIEVSRILSQTGLTAIEVKKALSALAKSALAPTFGDMTKTAEGAIAIMRQFKISVDDLEESLGMINAVASRFAVESEDIIAAVRRAGGAFAMAGGNLKELIALYTAVRSTTRESAESIATGFRTIFTRMQRVRTAKLLKNMGVEIRNMEGMFVGPYEAVKRLHQALMKISPRDPRFAMIIEELGGFRQVSKVIPLITQFTVAQKALAVAEKGTASMTEDVAIAQQALSIQIKKVAEEFDALLRKFSQDESFRNIVKLTLEFTKAIIRLVDALKPIMPVIVTSGTFAFARLVKGFLGRRTEGRGFLGNIGFAEGGVVPGAGNRDTVPAMLTPGEFVIRKKAVQTIGVGNLYKINKMQGGGEVFKPILKPRSRAFGDIGRKKQWWDARKEFLEAKLANGTITPEEMKELISLRARMNYIAKMRNLRLSRRHGMMQFGGGGLAPGLKYVKSGGKLHKAVATGLEDIEGNFDKIKDIGLVGLDITDWKNKGRQISFYGAVDNTKFNVHGFSAKPDVAKMIRGNIGRFVRKGVKKFIQMFSPYSSRDIPVQPIRSSGLASVSGRIFEMAISHLNRSLMQSNGKIGAGTQAIDIEGGLHPFLAERVFGDKSLSNMPVEVKHSINKEAKKSVDIKLYNRYLKDLGYAEGGEIPVRRLPMGIVSFFPHKHPSKHFKMKFDGYNTVVDVHYGAMKQKRSMQEIWDNEYIRSTVVGITRSVIRSLYKSRDFSSTFTPNDIPSEEKANIASVIFHNALNSLVTSLSPPKSVTNVSEQRTLDFPLGIGEAASLFGNAKLAGIPVEAIYSIDTRRKGRYFDKIKTYVEKMIGVREKQPGDIYDTRLLKRVKISEEQYQSMNTKLWPVRKYAAGGDVGKRKRGRPSVYVPWDTKGEHPATTVLKLGLVALDPREIIAPVMKRELKAGDIGKGYKKKALIQIITATPSRSYQNTVLHDILYTGVEAVARQSAMKMLSDVGEYELVNKLRGVKDIIPSGTMNDVVGKIFESAIDGMIRSVGEEKYSPAMQKWKSGRTIDFPAGLGQIAHRVFGNSDLADIPTEVKINFGEDTRSDLTGKLVTYAQKMLGLKKLEKSDPFNIKAAKTTVAEIGKASGGPIEDSVPALLTPGEFVINRKAARKIGKKNLEFLNNIDKFNKGGFVGMQGGGSVWERSPTLRLISGKGRAATREPVSAMLMVSVLSQLSNQLSETTGGMQSFLQVISNVGIQFATVQALFNTFTSGPLNKMYDRISELDKSTDNYAAEIAKQKKALAEVNSKLKDHTKGLSATEGTLLGSIKTTKQQLRIKKEDLMKTRGEFKQQKQALTTLVTKFKERYDFKSYGEALDYLKKQKPPNKGFEKIWKDTTAGRAQELLRRMDESQQKILTTKAEIGEMKKSTQELRRLIDLRKQESQRLQELRAQYEKDFKERSMLARRRKRLEKAMFISQAGTLLASIATGVGSELSRLAMEAVEKQQKSIRFAGISMGVETAARAGAYAGNIGMGAMVGGQLGMVFGPYGAAIGVGVGALAGAIKTYFFDDTVRKIRERAAEIKINKLSESIQENIGKLGSQFVTGKAKAGMVKDTLSKFSEQIETLLSPALSDEKFKQKQAELTKEGMSLAEQIIGWSKSGVISQKELGKILTSLEPDFAALGLSTREISVSMQTLNVAQQALEKQNLRVIKNMKVFNSMITQLSLATQDLQSALRISKAGTTGTVQIEDTSQKIFEMISSGQVTNMNLVRKAFSGVYSLGGSGAQLAETAFGEARLASVMPELLGRIAKRAKLEQEINPINVAVEEASKILSRTGISKEAQKAIRNNFASILGSIGGKQDIMKSLDLQKLPATIDKVNKELLKSVEQVSRINQELFKQVQAIKSLIDLRIKQEIDYINGIKGIIGKRYANIKELRELSGQKGPQIALARGALRFQMMSALQGTGMGAFSIRQLIRARRTAISKLGGLQALSERTGGFTTLSVEQRENALNQLNKWSDILAKSTNALKTFADNASIAAELQKAINEEQQKQLGRKDIATQLMLAGPKERRELLRNMTEAMKVVTGAKSIEQVKPGRKKDVWDIIGKLMGESAQDKLLAGFFGSKELVGLSPTKEAKKRIAELTQLYEQQDLARRGLLNKPMRFGTNIGQLARNISGVQKRIGGTKPPAELMNLASINMQKAVDKFDAVVQSLRDDFLRERTARKIYSQISDKVKKQYGGAPGFGPSYGPGSEVVDAEMKRKLEKYGMRVVQKQSGGIIPGVGNKDTIPSMLTPGEFVIRRSAVRKYGIDFLSKINKGVLPVQRFGDGGLVFSLPSGYDDKGRAQETLLWKNFGSSYTSLPSTLKKMEIEMIGFERLQLAGQAFADSAEKITKAAEVFPSKIEHSMNGRLEVILNGADVLRSLQPQFEQLIIKHVNNAINQFIKDKLPELGQSNV